MEAPTPRLLPVRAPFSLPRAIAFIRSFPPCAADFSLGDDFLRGALSIDGVGVGFALREASGALALDLDPALPEAVAARAAELVAAFVGADDSLDGFYAKAAGDCAPYRRIVKSLFGLHHVRFSTLAEITVYGVLMQRTPIAMASRMKRAFLRAFGRRVGDLLAFPSFPELAQLSEADMACAIGHPRKAAMLPRVIDGVAALGERFLRTAPYDFASAALQDIPGVGPFTAAAILLRGLGRMDHVPLEMPSFAEPARRVYGAAFDPDALRRRYREDLGYWAYYLKIAA
jgi:DNA-3-methyladenine glycosylase II